MQTTDPPVKVLLADGIHEAGVGTVEQLPLIYFLPPVLLLHLPFLPRMVETRMLRTKVLIKEQPPEPIFLKKKKNHVTRRWLWLPWPIPGGLSHRAQNEQKMGWGLVKEQKESFPSIAKGSRSETA